MQYTKEVEDMVCVAKGPNHGPAPIPEEGKCMQCGFVNEPGTFICANCGNFMPVPPGISQKASEAAEISNRE